jgi:hypothetical protein
VLFEGMTRESLSVEHVFLVMAVINKVVRIKLFYHNVALSVIKNKMENRYGHNYSLHKWTT